MSTIPQWVLGLFYWAHMVATIVWVGGLVTLSTLVQPVALNTLADGDYLKLFSRLQQKLQWLGWLCLGMLIVTGLFQMSAHPSYQGFLTIGNRWAAAILVKHLLVGVMVLLSGYLTWGLNPALQRLQLLQASGKEMGESEIKRLRQREVLLLRANLGLSIAVLAMTAWARVS